MYCIGIQYFYRLYSIKSYYKITAIIPCAVQYILVAIICVLLADHSESKQ